MVELASFLTIDEQPVSIKQALRYLSASGTLQSVLREITRQHLIQQALEKQDIKISSEAIEQVIIDLRREQQLIDAENFHNWLTSEGLDYKTLREQVALGLQLEQMKVQVAKPKLQEYFIERKLFLDKVVLSRLVVAERTLAEELKSQIVEDDARFEQLAQDYSLTEDASLNGMMGALSRGALPDTLRAAIDQAQPGDLIGPITLQGLWYLVRIEAFLPASLNASVKQQLESELFEQWLADQIQKTTVQLQVNL